MRQFFRSRWVWLTALLVFTGVLIFASWDRGIAIDYDGTGYLCTVPDDGTAEEIPVSFHGTFRRGTYTGSCDIAVIRLWTERTVTGDHISGRWDADDFSYIAIGGIDAARALAIMQ